MSDNLDTDAVKQPIQDHTPSINKRRISLATLVSSALLSLLVIFIVVNSIVINRFIDFQSILSQLTSTALPEVNLSRMTYSKANNLTYLTERLVQSETQAFRRIAYQDIEKTVEEIKELGLDKNNDEYLKTQLQVISQEFESLNLLIEKRIQIQSIMVSQEQKMYQLNDMLLGLTNDNGHNHENQYAVFSWALNFSEAVSASGKALAMNQLNQVRLQHNLIEQKLEAMIIESKNITLPEGFNANNLTVQLQNILISDTGLIPTRIKELRSIGQSTGRGNFVLNLVNDYVGHVQFYSFEINELVIRDIESTSVRIEEQTLVMGLMALFSILFLIATIYYLQTTVIKRLVLLNNSVLLSSKGENSHLDLGGNDEISDIAQSFNYFVKTIDEQNQKLHELSLTDGLTGIANRRALDKRLMSELQSGKRYRWPVSVLILDVDCFKSFNDHYGHLAGDDSLKAVAKALKSCQQRETDFVARFGGEEFVIILPDTSLKGAKRVAELILKSIVSLKITHEWNTASRYLTLSIGIATFNFEKPVSDIELLERADKALFQAKQQGKNRFICYGDTNG